MADHTDLPVYKCLCRMVPLMVDFPDAVTIDAVFAPDPPMLKLTVRVAAADLGKLIGRQGQTARALRIVMTSIAMAHQMHCSLEIAQAEPDPSPVVQREREPLAR